MAAAAVDVDGMESDPDRAFRINALGARNVAEACRRRGCRLSFISTDYVFDGALGRPYTEFDTPNPLSVYGRSKLSGERYVLESGGGFQVIRVSYIYGPDGPCFPDRVLRAAASGQPLRLVSDTRVSPTSTRQAARLIVRLSETGGPGIYHVAGGGQASPLQVAERVLAAAGVKPASVEAISAGDWPVAAARPIYSVLRPYVLELEHRSDLEAWQGEADHFGREWAERQPV
ncbi:MAG: NAD(P)-dependent oxidoreductase [Chloroflexi bacterium]|nr:NAD(P)-dependent oxidoreductase [Chloroflexota bacterium]